ncbi:uncharacterized protein C8R40DRAFT_1176943 [Lentinula edodes]|uniref:uncharacterized protein n=1 Tax=Lentinula edodes TaxID=5353 RepID=UPI001E8DB359|nr:uncharacterized protein C8R40DRAFT_1178891 [Lentinula edodes]XP_046078761.1 uncharacterized protein C8R40DRAFT_1178817 [Lentinula edodes]XP_046080363.1 uncharacterized protein C8R40DRAFT_1176943 [Lentinula edodes]KAH7867643.1 hypothetical protein C8R40DRAFT_1178891 [Lentinula edodes]KAH7867667.1 hypothetical protein C8R40DRAFT_1178817 [Lentinula edodes]KAH7869269.1 hypothetical protein C8R40DRAFT_1176943 [Lentinula edodes]
MVTGGGTYDDGQPIYLANLSAMEFEMVLAWLEHARWQPCSFSPSLPQLIALLQSARFLMMRSLLRQEIPLLKDSWLRPPVGALITTSLENILGLSSELNASLHTTVLSKIMLARETLNARRILLAYSIPKDDGSISPAAECSAEHHSTRCFQIWVAVWWGKVARKILHPDPKDRYLLSKLGVYLHSLTFDGMPPQCVLNFIYRVESSGSLEVENAIIDKATSSVKAYLCTLHMNADEFNFTEDEERDDMAYNF